MRKPSKGFTLIEVLVVLGIITVVGTLLLVIIVNSTGLFLKQSSKIEQGRGLNDVLSSIRNNIKAAQSIASSYPEGPSPEYSSGANQLVLKLASIDSLGNIIPGEFDYFVFFQDQIKVRFKIFPNGLSSRVLLDQILLTNADSLEFSYYDLANPPQEVAPTSASKIKITLSLKQKSGQEYEQSIATSEANLRND